MTEATLGAVRQALSAGETDCVTLVRDALTRLEANRHLNAVLDVYAEDALAQAAAIDEKRRRGEAGKLAGLVLGVKDNICQTGRRVRAASRILGNFESLFTATALERLVAEDAIVLASLNCDEFAMGSSNENSAFGLVRNPLDPERTPGGSSGGSAASVAAGFCMAALGSDTGGSIRQPASFCGLVGLKPTYGRVSRWGLIAFASSFDQIGPLTPDVDTAARLLEVMSGADPRDNTSASAPPPTYEAFRQAPEKTSYRIAILPEIINHEGLAPDIRNYILQLIDRLTNAGHVVEEVSFPFLDYLIPIYYVLTTAEASSNLGRYDGVRFGYRAEDAQTPADLYVRSRTEGFGPEVKRRIMLGAFVLSSGYYDAYYAKAQQIRRQIYDATRRIFDKHDFILMPTTLTTAFKLGEKTDDPLSMYLSDIYTVHANLAGNPAISLPMGTDSAGLPFGIHLLSDNFAETRLLQFSQYLMQ